MIGIWTTRLHEQSEVFLHHSPEKESVIRTLLNWIDEPPMDNKAVHELFKIEGEWAGAPDGRDTPLYDVEGTTVIGVFHVGGK